MATTAPEIVKVKKDVKQVSCDGGGALGHPRVFYTFDGKDVITCKYCDKEFIKK
tara:strand:- start:307 stop:468 length:162 start_codon:yes stop_codon:yes gene_type:complete